MSRRQILAGLATMAAGTGGTGAQALALPADDARLLTLSAAMTPLLEREEAAYAILAPLEAQEDDTAAHALVDAAVAETKAALRVLASVPAAGLTGLAVKALWAAHVLEEDWTDPCGLPDSLRADIARLVPAAVTS
jgi:hypothetical protein